MDKNSIVKPVIKIPQGRIEGFVLSSRKRKEYFGFYGIPYATAPERFELPRKWDGWGGGIRDCTNGKGMESQRCIQISSVTNRFFGSENCHFLSVYCPKFDVFERDEVKGNPPFEPKEKFPVMVFIHGGGYIKGAGDLFGNNYLADTDVILVTLNYRLGALGFLNTGDGTVPGNLGLHDQNMALRWVQENIAYFGGDKDNVCLMGQSAGAACVHFHMLSPLSTGLFSKAIMQSGNSLCPWAFNGRPVDKTKKLIRQLDLNGRYHYNMVEIVAKLKRLEPEALVAQRRNFHVLKEDLPIIHFAPSIDSCSDRAKAFLTDTPVQMLFTGKVINDVPMILGINAYEGLYRSLPIIRDKAKLTSLNERWSQDLPTHLMYKKEDVSSHEDFARKIRRFYFENRTSVLPAGHYANASLTSMLSDRLFNYPTRKTALLHRSLTTDSENKKIFLYYFDYFGDYSYYNGFESKETFGASHSDELQYLMNQRIFYSKIMAGSEADGIIDKMIALWGSFAWTGTPSYPGQTNPWLPMPLKDEIEDDIVKYYKIGVHDGMIVEPFTDRMEFWDRTQNLSLTF